MPYPQLTWAWSTAPTNSQALPSEAPKIVLAKPVQKRNPDAPLEKWNINLHDRPIIKNPDWSISTVHSSSFNIDWHEVLLPMVRKWLDRLMTNQEAIDWYHKTWEHLWKFSNAKAANKYANRLHLAQQQEYGNTPVSLQDRLNKAK